MVSRGQIKEFDSIERIDVRQLFFTLKDYAIDIELQRDIYRDMVILTANSQNPEKFTILDKIQKLYNKKYKTSIEKLIEGYAKEFENGGSKEKVIRFKNKDKKKVRDLVKLLGEK